MPTTPISDLPYPSGAAAPAAAADLMALALALDNGALLTATDEAERDTKYGTVPAGALVAVGAGAAMQVWIKTGATAGDWTLVWRGQDTTTPSMRGDWTNDGWRVRRTGTTCTLEGALRRGSTTLAASGGYEDCGQITDPGFYPLTDSIETAAVGITAGQLNLQVTSAGLIQIRCQNNTLASGRRVGVNAVWTVNA